VAQLINNLGVDFVVTVGDNVYGSNIDNQIGQFYSNWIGNYVGSYGSGSAINKFFPAIGNHEYSDLSSISDYLNYFTLPGNERYYTFTAGPVEFFVLNSTPQEVDGDTANSIQGKWLKSELASSDSLYKIVYFHHAPYSSAGTTSYMQWPFEDWGATAVLAGHRHVYERVMRDDNQDGYIMPYFVDGLGGQSKGSFNKTPISGSELRYNADYGAMLVDASNDAITFKFIAATGGQGTVIDSFTIDLTPAVQTAAATVSTAKTAAPSFDSASDPVAVHPAMGHAQVLDLLGLTRMSHSWEFA
jgi:hypothetical protein